MKLRFPLELENLEYIQTLPEAVQQFQIQHDCFFKPEARESYSSQEEVFERLEDNNELFNNNKHSMKCSFVEHMTTIRMLNLLYFFILASILMAQFNDADASEKLNKDTVSKVDRFLTDSIQNGFSGSILISEKGIKKINKGYGYADKEKKVNNHALTVFDLGSNTKQFTGAAIMLLAQRGHLSLTDEISDFFKHLPDDKKAITIHQLLIHTSGLPEAIGRDFEPISEEDFFRQVFQSELLFPIGSQYAYSNIGYSVLAKIIEHISGQSYEAFLHQHLFIPNGMYNTGYLFPEWKHQNLAKGYAMGVINQGAMVEKYQQQKRVFWHLIGNGGINSTQEDMYLWINALKKNAVLSAESFKQLTAGYSTIFDGFRYGYGWGVNDSMNATQRLSHNGSNGSFAHNIIWLPDEDILILFASNAASPLTEQMAKTIEKIIFQPSFDAKPIQKNPYFLVFEFIDNNDHHQANTLFSLIKSDYLKDFSKSDILNRIGYQLLKNQQRQWAIEVFKMNSVLFSKEGNVWDSLGEAYAADNQKDNANNSFNKAISLGNEESIPKLQHK